MAGRPHGNDSTPIWGPAALALAVLLVTSLPGWIQEASPGDDSWFDDRLVCEEAVARLGRCCPGADLRAVRCDYQHHASCETSYTRYPDVSRPESECIRDLSCEAIRERDICARVLAQDRYVDEGVETTSAGPTSEVCP